MNREELLEIFPELKDTEYYDGSFTTNKAGELDRLWHIVLKNSVKFELDVKNFVSLSATINIKTITDPFDYSGFDVQFNHSCNGYAKSTLMKIPNDNWSEFDYVDIAVATFNQLNLTPEYWTPLIGNYRGRV